MRDETKAPASPSPNFAASGEIARQAKPSDRRKKIWEEVKPVCIALLPAVLAFGGAIIGSCSVLNQRPSATGATLETRVELRHKPYADLLEALHRAAILSQSSDEKKTPEQFTKAHRALAEIDPFLDDAAHKSVWAHLNAFEQDCTKLSGLEPGDDAERSKLLAAMSTAHQGISDELRTQLFSKPRDE